MQEHPQAYLERERGREDHPRKDPKQSQVYMRLGYVSF